MARKAIYKHATEVNTSTYPDDGSSPVGTTEWNEDPAQQGMYGNTPTTSTVTIATGVLTVTDSVTVAAAETGTSDTLDKLAITNTSQYDLIYLFADTGDTITLTNTSSLAASGQVQTISGADEVLSTTKPTILIRKGSYWYGYGGGTTADGSVTNIKLADMAANTIKVRDSSSAGVPSDKAVGTTEILIGDGTGFTAAALSGDATMTNAGVVSVATLNQNTTGSSASCTGNSSTVTTNANLTGGVTSVGNAATVVTNANLTGDVTSVGNATTTVTNANLTGIVTSTGNATAIANGAIATGKISGFDTQVQTSRLDQMATATADVALGSQKITGLADGTAAQDAATKNQVDVAQAGLDAKDSCRVATTANITLSGEQTIDGVTTTTDRVLVKNQTTGSQNGIYVSASGAWARSTDADASVEVTAGLYTLITEGTTLAGQGFVLTTDDPITVGTTALTFSQFSGVGDLVGGTGITKTGNSIAVDASQTQITSVGALGTGSITSGFGAINNGSSTITTTGAVATGALTVTGTITGALTGNVTGDVTGSSGSTTGNAATATTATTVTDDAITLAKMASGTDGNLITYDTNGDPVAVATGTATHVLTSNGAGAAPTFQAAAGGSTLAYTPFANNASTTYAGNQTVFTTVGVGERDIYIKKIDASNEGVFTKIWKNGSATEVQIA